MYNTTDNAPPTYATATRTQRLAFRGKKPNRRSAAHATSHLRHKRAGIPSQNITAIDAMSAQYSISVTWDGNDMSLLFDTGSSDTWAVRSDFTCRTSLDVVAEQAACLWGPSLVNDFSHGQDPLLHFQTRYGSGEKCVGLANDTYWNGNNATNGILGMAYPALTSGYGGYDAGGESSYRQTYQPIFSSMVSQGLVAPVFAVALEKGPKGGLVGWGGLPDISWTPMAIASTDILIASVSSFPDASSQYTFYTVVTDGIQYGQVQDSRKYLYIVDTGTTLLYLPPELAESIAQSFSPPAIYLYQYGAYFAPCDASSPRIAIIINNVKLWLNPADLIYSDFKDSATGYCAIGVTTGGEGPYILGDVFLQSVMTVFDIGAAQMRFYGKYL
ncbi:putative aspartic-type endopeptidase [Ceratocystis platani]|uniref:Putative aspartic-type endopeptidase n=1 Tax=Ceratocystis fimbriata f. sp. platani TaxID=88771 RepID=A0A0F8CUN0_CERFI|nr:putative aspartic-type endopeptidase [Ceratocystis platani]